MQKDYLKIATDVLSKQIDAVIEEDIKVQNTILDIKIIPANLKIGEDLSGRAPLPIFKKGNYILIRGTYSPYFVKSYQEGERKEFFMEPIEDDIATLCEEIPKYKNEIKKLELRLTQKTSRTINEEENKEGTLCNSYNLKQ